MNASTTTILTGLLSLALFSPAIAADFSGSLKGVAITDSQEANKPPVAAFTYAIDGDVVTFNAGSTYDPDGSITKYTWDFGDGSIGEGESVTHQYSSLTSMPVSLTVVDDKNGVMIVQQRVAKTEPMWIGETLGKNTWSLIHVDSQETTGENGAATNAFDNNPSTFWHTEWYTSSPTPPHEIQIDLNNTYAIDKLLYLPRQIGANGQVCDYELYLSTDKNNWGAPVITGKFDTAITQKEVTFSSKNGRYVRFRAMRECNDNPWTSVAEIDFHGISNF